MSLNTHRVNDPTRLLHINLLSLATMSVQAKENPDKWFYPVCVITYGQNEEIVHQEIFRYSEMGELDAESVRAFQDYSAHSTTGVICCLCRPLAPALLVLRRIENTFTLSRAPGSASSHRPNCSYSLDSSRETAPALPEPDAASPDWTIAPASIKRFLGDGVAVRRRSAREKARPPRRPAGFKVSRPALITLIYRLMHDAKTNVYNPLVGALSYNGLMSTLAEAA